MKAKTMIQDLQALVEFEELTDSEASTVVGGADFKTSKYTLSIPSVTPTIEADVTGKLIGDSGIIALGTIHGSLAD